MILYGERDPALINDWPFIRQTAVAVDYELRGYAHSAMEIWLHPNMDLPSGELIIESPKWLLNKVFRLKLKKNKLFTKGINIKINVPSEWCSTKVEFEPPKNEKPAFIGLTVYKNNDDPEVITATMGSSLRNPDIHCIPMGEPFTTLNHFAVKELALAPEVLWPELHRPSVIVFSKPVERIGKIEHEKLSISLFKVNKESEKMVDLRVYDISGENSNLLSQGKHVNQNKIECEYSCAYVKHAKTTARVKLDPNVALNGGELVLNSKWLVNKTIHINLPVDNKLENGIVVIVQKIPEIHRTRINYCLPEGDKLAQIFVATSGTSSESKKEIITCQFDDDTSMDPNQSELEKEPMQSNSSAERKASVESKSNPKPKQPRKRTKPSKNSMKTKNVPRKKREKSGN